MHLRASQKDFCLYCVCIVYAVSMTTHENRSFPLQTFFSSFKNHHKIFNSCKLVNFFSSEGGPSLAHSKHITFIGEKCPNFEGGWMEV